MAATLVEMHDPMPVYVEPLQVGAPPLIPEPHPTVRHLMLAMSLLIDGKVDVDPARNNPAAANCFELPAASLILAGTRCRRPLMVREVATVGRQVGRDAIVVRTGREFEPARISFDIHLLHGGLPLMGYRLWMPQPAGNAWLVPSTSEEPFIRLDPNGLDVGDCWPFVDEFDLHRGMVWANQYLSVATKGWF